VNEARTGNETLTLRGIDGANPLGFLAALGTLVVARAAGQATARLRWTRARTWVPVVERLAVAEEKAFCAVFADALQGKLVPDNAEKRRAEAEKAFKDARNAVKRKRDEIKKRRLQRDEQRAAVDCEVEPLQADCDRKRAAWLTALRDAVPRPELALGMRIDCTAAEFREHAASMLASSHFAERECVDLLAAFATDGCLLETSDAVEPTPLCFTNGSGQQYMLDTVRQLMDEVDDERVRRTLFERWTYPDEKLSMRWDPIAAGGRATKGLRRADARPEEAAGDDVVGASRAARA